MVIKMKESKKYWVHASYLYSCDRDEWLCIGEVLPDMVKERCEIENIEIKYI